jgi:hypothetical protein
LGSPMEDKSVIVAWNNLGMHCYNSDFSARLKSLISSRHRPLAGLRVVSGCRARAARPAWSALAVVIAIALLLGSLGCQARPPSQPTPPARPTPSSQPAPEQALAQTISAPVLEQEYGLRVTLIGVTAAGGMVDLRLQVLDAEKARPLLTDPARLPSLIVPGDDVTLSNPGSADPDLPVEDGRVFFVLFPNSGSAVKPGTSVIVAFGDLRLEPMTAQ